ncbi:hypothetical protein GQ54DRAFT_168527 [Martensiomyces pterosporus]|nr:hypothetical protein GQ54DRAFT_168527 [Martensiomyces pterosporus]
MGVLVCCGIRKKRKKGVAGTTDVKERVEQWREGCGRRLAAALCARQRKKGARRACPVAIPRVSALLGAGPHAVHTPSLAVYCSRPMQKTYSKAAGGPVASPLFGSASGQKPRMGGAMDLSWWRRSQQSHVAMQVGPSWINFYCFYMPIQLSI